MKKESLFILPFDHRSSFLKKMFDIKDREPSKEEMEKAKELKEVIYQGFLSAVKNEGVPKTSAAILVDDQFGEKIIKDAIDSGHTVCISTEKSGQEEFEFEYGDDFGKRLNEYHPTFAKALVRYNPEGDKDLNTRQRLKLKRLSDFCRENDYGLIIEPLVPATDDQMMRVSGDKLRYDNELRPELMVRMIKEMKNEGIKPDIWKIEGLEDPNDYKSLINEIKSDGNEKANAIVLGRGADDNQVKKWLVAGAGVEGIIGFAVGRTIFWQSLVDYKDGKIDKNTATQQIGERYKKFYDIFIKAKIECGHC